MTAPAAPAFTADGPGTPAAVWAQHLDPGRDPLGLDGVRRLVVVGAHPDDESLGAGGLVASAAEAGVPVVLVCATDGEASHPRSPTHAAESLAARRVAEWQDAARVLGVQEQHRLRLPDGSVADRVPELAARLVEIVGDGGGTVLVATWREDGHPDHAAVGRAAAAAARRTDADLWEFPVWFWHWATPHDPRAQRLRPWALAETAQDTKQQAVAVHRSQVEPLSAAAGDERLLEPAVLAHFTGDHEWFAVTPGRDCPDDTLEDLHREQPDPWGADDRWYEQRKRQLLLASLPRPRFERALEVGCSTGALTAALARRAEHVLGVDRSPTALAAAGRRLRDVPQVTLADLDLPWAWPEGSFDLVVVSEVGYFLSPRAVDALVDRIGACLDPDGVVVLCHWRHPVEGWLLDAAEVHRRFEAGALPPVRAEYRDRDVEIRVQAHEWPEHDR